MYAILRVQGGQRPHRTHTTIQRLIGKARHSPFALAVHFVLRERNILVVNDDPKVVRDLTQVLISRPL